MEALQRVTSDELDLDKVAVVTDNLLIETFSFMKTRGKKLISNHATL